MVNDKNKLAGLEKILKFDNTKVLIVVMAVTIIVLLTFIVFSGPKKNIVKQAVLKTSNQKYTLVINSVSVNAPKKTYKLKKGGD